MNLDLVLLVISAVCFAIAAFFSSRFEGRVDLVAAGLFFWILTAIV